MANSLISGPDSISFTNGLYSTTKPIIKDGETLFQIGHGVKSQTKSPSFYVLDDKSPNVYLVDGPGINDNNLKHEYSN